MGIYLIECGKCVVQSIDKKILCEIGRGDSFGDSYIFKKIVSA